MVKLKTNVNSNELLVIILTDCFVSLLIYLITDDFFTISAGIGKCKLSSDNVAVCSFYEWLSFLKIRMPVSCKYWF